MITEWLKRIVLGAYYLSGLPQLRVARLQKVQPLVRIVAYHDIGEKDQHQFARQLLYLTKRYNVITPEDFVHKRFRRDAINVLITADDGYHSWHTTAPLFRQYGIRPIFFITSGFIDTQGTDAEKEFCKNNLQINHRKPLSWEEVRGLADWAELGGHTHMHYPMNTSKINVKEDCAKNKQKLEELIGQTIRFFAYPYGTTESGSFEQATVLQELGYQYACTTEQGFVLDAELYTLPRTMLEPSYPLWYVRLLTEGTYDTIKPLL